MGGLTTLINNAGKDDRHAIEDVTPEYWDNCMNINLRPHFFTMQKAAELMTGGGSVINLGSISWMRGRPGIAGYSCAMGAISALTRTMARELGPRGIRVNSVVPGAVVTERQIKLWLTPELDQQFLDMQALKFRIQPDDIVAMALFLASDDSRACTGQNFIVDAGIV
jgi:NAD(P)-dependent dehydrogenase (short-subunit alcohol dehydrogenase family)